MKNELLLPYPVVTDSFTEELDIDDNIGGIKNSLFTNFGDVRKKLIVDDISQNFYTIRNEQDMLWHPQNNNLIIVYDFVIRNTDLFFNTGRGIASCGSTLGLAIKWNNRSSKIRGVFSLEGDNISAEANQSHFYGEYAFPSKLFRGDLVLELIVYLKSSDSYLGINSYCQKVGTNLGVLFSNKIHIAGGGSIFPYIDREDPEEKSLWGIYIDDSVDFEYTEFDEDNVSLWYNSCHPDYLKYGLDKTFDSAFFNEMLASFFYNLIVTVHIKMQGELLKPKTGKKNTIANYVRILITSVFKVTEEVKCSDYLSMYRKIRNNIVNNGGTK